MSALSDYAEKAVLDHILRNTPFTQPAALYVAVSTTPFDEDGTGTGEIVGNGYARQPVTFAPAVIVVGGDTTASSDSLAEFGPATVSWGLVRYIAIFDAETGGNMLWLGTLNPGRTVGIGDTLRMNLDSITCTIA